MSIEAFYLGGSATLSFTDDMDEFKSPESIHFTSATDAVRHAVEKLRSDQLWSASIVDSKGTRIGQAQIRSVYETFA